MLKLPVIRWGQPYDSLEVAEVNHFATGEPIAKVSQAGGGIIKRDMRQAQQARDALLPILLPRADRDARQGGRSLRARHAADGRRHAVARRFRASAVGQHRPARAHVPGQHGEEFFVLKNMEKILDCLTRGLDLEILSRGYGEEGRGVTVSYQAQSPVLAAVLPSNSPGVHTLWLPVIPLQMGLVLKPGPQEPWTPYRIFAAFTEAGVPREAFSLYPGEAEAGAAVLEACDRAMIFGGTATVDRYRGNPKVQAHGPGFSKILLGDDVVDRWPDYLDLMVESIYHQQRPRLHQLLRHLGLAPHARNCRRAGRAAGTDRSAAADRSESRPGGVHRARHGRRRLEADRAGPARRRASRTSTAKYGPRLVEQERASYLRPTIIHAPSPEAPVAQKEYMFPFASVVECPQAEMLKRIGPTLVGTVITNDESFRQAATNATQHRPPEPRPDPHHEAQLAATARRESHSSSCSAIGRCKSVPPT